MSTTLQIIYAIVSVALILLVLSQKSKDNGFSTITGAQSSGKEIGKSFEKKLQVWTTWLIVVYIIISIVITFFQEAILQRENNAFNNDEEIVENVVEAEDEEVAEEVAE